MSHAKVLQGKGSTFISQLIDPITVLQAILTGREPCEKLQRLYKNPMSNKFWKKSILKT